MAGQGIAILNSLMTTDAVQVGLLQVVLGDYAAIGPGVAFIFLERQNLSARVRLFVDFLVRLIPPDPPWDQKVIAAKS